MSSSTAIALSASANANAALAQAAAEKARCTSVTATYQPQNAGVVEMRDYANCVIALHGSGQPLTGPETIAIKVVILVCFAAAAFGGYKGWWFDGPGGAFFGALIGPFVIGCAAVLLALVAWAIGFLLT